MLTVDYNNGHPNHLETLVLDSSRAGSRRITWGGRPAPAGKAFDGWTLDTDDPAHVSLSGSTIVWTARVDNAGIVTVATATARWRTLDAPGISLNIHADGSRNQWGNTDPWAEITATAPASAATDDSIRLDSLNGTGYTGYTGTCTPTAGTGRCTFRLTIGQLRDVANFEARYHLKASVSAVDRRDTDTVVTGTPADSQDILPYTTVSYLTGDGTGTPPPNTKALTDTDSRTARITVAGPDPITRPAHNLFTIWRAEHGTVRPGTTPVAASLGNTTQGRTSVTLTATWNTLAAPGPASAMREPSDNRVTITGTAKPRSPADTVRICHPGSGGIQCDDVATGPNDARGNPLPYDGTSEHQWTLTLPASTPDGQLTIDTTLNSKDPAYPDSSQPVQSATTRGTIRIITYHYVNALPLTGGRTARMLALAAALCAATLLTAVANILRNRRHTHDRAKHIRT